MVEKTEGAKWDCVTCGTHLVCRMKDYDGDFKSKLQWQNEDGSAHFSYDGHDFSCNTPPNSDTSSTPDPNPTPPSETSKDDSDVQRQAEKEMNEDPSSSTPQQTFTMKGNKITDNWIKNEMVLLSHMADQISIFLEKKYKTKPEGATIGMYLKRLDEKLMRR